MEIIIDESGRQLLKYSEEDITQAQQLLSKIPDIGRIENGILSSDGTRSDFLNFWLHGRFYNIRMSDHAQGACYEDVACGIVETYFGVWMVDATIGHYKPSDVVAIVENLDAGLRKYTSEEEWAKLKAFANPKIQEYYEDDELLLSYRERSKSLARDYIAEYQIIDDEYGTQSHVLEALLNAVFLAPNECMVGEDGGLPTEYSDDDIAMTRRLLSQIPGISEVKMTTLSPDDGNAVCLKFQFHDRFYRIRMSRHERWSRRDGNARAICGRVRHLAIDASAGHYKPADMVKIVETLDETLAKYTSEKELKKLKRFATIRLLELEEQEEVFRCYEEDEGEDVSFDDEMKFARDYLCEHRVMDDSYGMKAKALRLLFHMILYW